MQLQYLTTKGFDHGNGLVGGVNFMSNLIGPARRNIYEQQMAAQGASDPSQPVPTLDDTLVQVAEAVQVATNLTRKTLRCTPLPSHPQPASHPSTAQ